MKPKRPKLRPKLQLRQLRIRNVTMVNLNIFLWLEN